jgi:hypothetical protein
LQYNVIALIPIAPKVVIRANPLERPQPPTGWVFSFSNSNSCKDLTYNIQSHNFLFNISYSGSESYIYTAPAPFDITDYKFNNARKRKSKHSRRLAFIMQKFGIKSVSMITLTVQFNGVYKSAKEYDIALNRIRRLFSYYGINRITGSELTKKGVKHYHILLDSKDIIKICSSNSFKRFVKSYRFSENDFKAIHSKDKKKKRSYLDIYLARWFAIRWRLGFVDFLFNAKALYVVKYVNESYNNELSFHGRLSYSKEFSKEFKNKTSIVRCGFNNSVVRSVPNFQIPIFFIPAVLKQIKHLIFERLRSEALRSVEKSIYEKYKYYLNNVNFPRFYSAVERLGFLEGY